MKSDLQDISLCCKNTAENRHYSFANFLTDWFGKFSKTEYQISFNFPYTPSKTSKILRKYKVIEYNVHHLHH